jgi:hypothetical protein
MSEEDPRERPIREVRVHPGLTPPPDGPVAPGLTPARGFATPMPMPLLRASQPEPVPVPPPVAETVSPLDFPPKRRPPTAVILLAGIAFGGIVAALALRSRPAPAPPPPPVVAATPAPPPKIEPVPVPEPAIVEPEPVAAPPVKPSRPTELAVTKQGKQSWVEIPLAGSTKGMAKFNLSKPRGTAVKLPRGRPTLRAGVYEPGAPFTTVKIIRKGSASLIQFHYRAGLKPSVKADGQTLRFSLR